MLRLSGITKNYRVADTTVRALKGIDIAFRENEFVSVLGPSGCGKTTLLNLVGGLDKYTTGNLFINGRSTKEFRDKDWDVYRNHRVGFIFQSYNLIPHQSVLSNVELALTIAGMSKGERIAKAKLALDKVGLRDQYYKRPNQLSGGQGQRVAIARALVNDPDILLADEPTGALDTTTSAQIMELIKEIAKEKLVIMVTHNPDIAKMYSTRIVTLLDGELQSDSNPFSLEEEQAENEAKKAREEKSACAHSGKRAAFKRKNKKQRAKMSYWTAFRLSLQNLFTKKARTILTSVAGSIGIIGVSMVLSISFGIQTFIDGMQNDMLSGNPIEIAQTGFDMSVMIQNTTVLDKVEAIREYGYVNVDSMMEFLASRVVSADDVMLENSITQEYIDYLLALPKEYAAAIKLDYGLDVTNSIYTDFRQSDETAPQNISISAIKTIYTSILDQSPYAAYSDYVESMTESFMQAPDSEEYILTQYDILYGKIAKEKNEIMLVLEEDSMLTDLFLAQLGYYTQDEFMNIVYKASPNDDGSINPLYDSSLDKSRFSYEELIGKKFVWYPNDDIFTLTDSPYAPYEYNAYSKNTFKDGIELTIAGLLEPKENVSYGCLTSGLYYTEELAKHIVEVNLNSNIVKSIREGGKDSISSGEQTVALPDGTLVSSPMGITFKYSYSYLGDTFNDVTGFVGSQSPFMSMAGSFLSVMGDNQMEEMAKMKTINLQNLGGVDLAHTIYVYPVDFVQKEFVLEHLDRWNSEETLTFYSAAKNGDITLTADERDDIKYIDALSIIIAMITTLIDIITFALIGFTSLALVVSCVMIGIITYVSVVERIKEIGVIRSLGGRKKDVSNLFTAETFIIGLISGLIGIAVTYLASAGINSLISRIQDGITRIAIFPWHYAVIMVSVSVFLTLMSGLVPSRAAAKKDPVVALRTE